MLLSQRQGFLNNHPRRVPITPDQKGAIEMRDEVLSSIGVQDVDTSGYQVCDLDDVEIYRENGQVDVDTLFRPGIVTPSSPSTFNNFELVSIAENTSLIDKEQEKENSPPPTTSRKTSRDYEKEKPSPFL